MKSQSEKAAGFRALHERARAFIIPNPWDIGTAKMLEALGFEALAGTSAGFAQSIGKIDGAVDRDTMLAHVAQLAAATDLPLSADLENGYADKPAGVAETVRLAAAAGLSGCSIEDLPLGRDGEPYEIAFAAERIRAAAEAAHALPFTFTLTARAENFIAGQPRPRGYHCATTGLPRGRRRRSLRAGSSYERRYRNRRSQRRSSGERAHGTPRRAIESCRSERTGRQARKRRKCPFARRVQRGAARRDRNARSRNVYALELAREQLRRCKPDEAAA